MFSERRAIRGPYNSLPEGLAGRNLKVKRTTAVVECFCSTRR